MVVKGVWSEIGGSKTSVYEVVACRVLSDCKLAAIVCYNLSLTNQ